ncbi:MAG: dTMP kinase [Bacillota bacterium]
MVVGRGLFIVFEGIDGTGKTTQAGLLAEAVARRGHRVLVTREPGGTELGEALRKILLFGSEPIDPTAELLMYAAARAQNVARKILPSLREGMVVISDRFSDSTYAYQGCGKGISATLIEQVGSLSGMGLIPDLTILLDMRPERALSRLKGPPDRMEGEGAEFLGRVREGFLARAAADPGRYLVLDGEKSEEELFQRVFAAVLKYLEA